ncbi:MAG: phosphatidate cytidylyltransferase [Methylovirgula sp.]|uniref:phosphatidate cytidylyltransferase n=1 Tax=Methylovirgula sp. TaxID=1978224 RepID=UPI00307636BD
MTYSKEASGPSAPHTGEEAAAGRGLSSLNARLADLGPRLGSAAGLIAIAVISWWLGGIVFFFVWLVAALVVHFEWQRIVGGERLTARLALGSVTLVAAAIAVRSQIPALGVFILLVMALVVGQLGGPGRRAWFGGGLIYAGGLIIAVLTLRSSFPFGRWAVGLLFAIVWGTDAAAYFAGRLIGGPKFMPLISPSKTWSGTGVGIVTGALVGLGFLAVAARFSQFDAIAPSFALLLLGLILAAVSQLGDLFESWMKRCFGAKDSGHLIPGHGGLMDRVDGFIATAVFAAILGVLRAFPSPAEGLFHWM